MGAVLIGIPSYDGEIKARLSSALMNEARADDTPPFTVAHKQVSLLAFGFNQLWCMALNNRHLFDYFLMLHSDVAPVNVGWLRMLVNEMHTLHADVLSVVLPLKDEKGLTSTALYPDLATAHQLGMERVKRRRLALREIQALPISFNAADACSALNYAGANPVLLVNTGFMLVDLRNAWVEQVYFTIRDCVWRMADGKFASDVEPEDWYFSARAAELGARVYATRCVEALHFGGQPFPNHGEWGTWDYDRCIDGTLQGETQT